MNKNCKENIEVLETFGKEVQDLFKEIYGNDRLLNEERRQAYITALKKHLDSFGNCISFVSRSPARVNLMGKHIEHNGGSVNSLAVSRETISVVSERNDGLICITNVDNRFESYNFSIPEVGTVSHFSSWTDYIESEDILKEVEENRGKWVNYVKASVYKIRAMFPKAKLKGMNMTFSGNIPPAAGLSSSSSIVVTTALAFLKANDIKMSPSALTVVCGEAEWFVGSRGGAGDHAAMICSMKNAVTHFSFFPFCIGKSVEFPENFAVIAANSFVEAKKSGNAKDKFNAKVACYKFGLIILRSKYPQFRERLKLLRDFNAENLGVSQSEIYKMLISLPEKINAEELLKNYSSEREEILHILSSHSTSEPYNIRGTILYGISECARADRFIDAFGEKDYKEIAEMMYTSHNGDRVEKSGKMYVCDTTDEEMLRLSSSSSQESELFMQSGNYGCSLKEIDYLTDFALSLDGVISAELSGAGLGGCVVILAEKSESDNILEKLYNGYYKKKGLPQGALKLTSVKGAMVIADFKKIRNNL